MRLSCTILIIDRLNQIIKEVIGIKNLAYTKSV